MFFIGDDFGSVYKQKSSLRRRPKRREDRNKVYPNSALKWYLRRMEKKIYRAADHCVGLSPGMVDAFEIGFLTAYLASDKSWAVTGEVIMAGGGSGNAVYY